MTPLILGKKHVKHLSAMIPDMPATEVINSNGKPVKQKKDASKGLVGTESPDTNKPSKSKVNLPPSCHLLTITLRRHQGSSETCGCRRQRLRAGKAWEKDTEEEKEGEKEEEGKDISYVDE